MSGPFNTGWARPHHVSPENALSPSGEAQSVKAFTEGSVWQGAVGGLHCRS